MSKVNFVLVNAEILPKVYSKVLVAKELIASGDAKSATEAAKMAGISRSAYYKYKDAIFEYNSELREETATLNARLMDNAGVLSSVMNRLYEVGANILSVNQNIPVNNIALISITVRISEMKITTEDLLEKLKLIDGVKTVDLS